MTHPRAGAGTGRASKWALVGLALLAWLMLGLESSAAGPQGVVHETVSAGARLPVPERDPDDVSSTARRVLARPEFQVPGPTLLERIGDWLFDRAASAVDTLLGGGRAGILAWLLVPGAVVLGFFLLRFTRGVTTDATRRAGPDVARRRPPEDWRAEAEVNARAGRWREAVRCRYRALVADLGTRGLLEEVPGRTAGEYRHEVTANAPGVAAEFSQASELFEVAWYGHEPTGEQQDQRLRALADRVLSH